MKRCPGRIGLKSNEFVKSGSVVAILAFLTVLAPQWCDDLAAQPTSVLQTVALSGQPVPGLDSTVYRADYHPTAFLEPQLNSAGELLFRAGIRRGGSDDDAIITGLPESLRVVAFTGSSAPGTEADVAFTLFTLEYFTFNDLGEVAFHATVYGPGIDYDTMEGVWTESGGGGMRLAVRRGDQVPDMAAGVQYAEFDPPRLSNDGQLLVPAGIDRIPNSSLRQDVEGYWIETRDSGLQLLAQEWQPSPPGFPDGVLKISQVTLTRGGQAYVLGAASVNPSPYTSHDYSAVWTGNSFESLSQVFDGRGPIPNVSDLRDFSFTFSSTQANESGTVAAVATLRAYEGADLITKKGLWTVQPDGSVRPVAIMGEQPSGMPAGSFFSDEFFRFEVNDAGRTAFTTKSATPGDSFQRNTLFVERADGDLLLIAREGQHAPGTPPGVVFGNPTWSTNVEGNVFGYPAFNNAGQVAFLGELLGEGIDSYNDVGLWATTPSGEMTLLAREGDQLEVAPGDFRTVYHLEFVGGRGDARNLRTGLNDDGLIAFSAYFTDGTSGLFLAHLMIPEPSSLVLLVSAGAMACTARRHARRRSVGRKTKTPGRVSSRCGCKPDGHRASETEK